ncbi:MAG: hypothetical protein AAFR75_00285 [Pseudomonadota bacterium]
MLVSALGLSVVLINAYQHHRETALLKDFFENNEDPKLAAVVANSPTVKAELTKLVQDAVTNDMPDLQFRREFRSTLSREFERKLWP